jgi:probable HAF family extracellular repeat protein
MFPAGAFFRRAAVAAASLATVVAAHAAPAPRYSITEIAAPAMTWIEVTAVNNRGDVAGYFRSPQPGVSFEPEQGFLWSNGVLTPLGFPTAIRDSRIFGMNDKGVLVGGVGGGNAYTWQDGAWQDLGFMGEGHSINKSGAIAGTTHASGFSRGFFYANGVLWDIGMNTGFFQSFANSVNDKNVVVGTMEVNSIGNRHGFVWSAGTLTDVGTLGGPSSTLNGINNKGYAVGWSFDRDFGIASAQWTGDLSRLVNAPGTHLATAVNEHGAAVGTIDSGAFLYDSGVLTRLDQLPAVVNNGWTGLVPSAINDRGWIVGRGFRNGLPRGFVLIP